ncbi:MULTISPECIES: tyrosine-type recombinase/integrase [Kaistia]|uniref:Tyrosine-type recombinase/integrase n=1 Tax=Kaistia nematophila TaxID=2994654 RepID=A0A9X3DYL3_9HYPH|nr:tyrosine-type recombinase/integrase [Kaistia nematophila]MCX5568167.1 tyrosine-type recombinase/integrase [Kaistia nematophila]
MNPSNERLRHAYIEHLRDAKKYSDKTIDAAMRHLSELERFLDGNDFERLTKSEAKAFSERVHQRPSKAGAETLSDSSIVHTLSDLRAFYGWLTTIKNRKVDLEAVARLTPSRRVLMGLRTQPDKAPPTPDHIRRVLAAMDDQTVIERRDRALVAFIFLTGMRVGAVISLRCKHVKLADRQVMQDAREVNTKFGKNMLTSWFPVGDDIEHIVVAWVKERLESGAKPDAPLFPAKPRYRLPGDETPEKDAFWKTSEPVREVFQEACQAAGIDYINPHSVRDTLMLLGLEMCATWEELKAWSQNLGHEKLDTSMVHYGKLDTNRQTDLMQSLVRTDLTVRAEQEMLMLFRRAPPKTRDSVLHLLSRA